MPGPQDALPPNSGEYRGGTFRAVIIVLTVVSAAAVILRFVSRSLGKNGNRFWWDDWAALVALPLIMAQMGICFAMLNYGLGHHIWVADPSKLTTFFKLLYSIYYVYDFALAVTKVSALLFLSRIFPKRQSPAWFNYAIYATHALNVAWLIGIIFGTVFQCNPVQKGWSPMMDGKCGSTNALWLGSAVPSVVIDLVILLLPLPRIWGLQMSRAKKGGITLVFLLGYLVIIVSLGRLITVLKTSQEVNSDPTYEIIPMSLWVTAEAPITTLCICLPAMLPLGRHLVNVYLSPLASKISSTWTSRGDNGSSLRSKSGNFASATESGNFGLKLRSAKTSNHSTSGDEESLHSSNSMRGILPRHDEYSARVQVGEPMPYGVATTTDRAVHVEKAFAVDRREQQ